MSNKPSLSETLEAKQPQSKLGQFVETIKDAIEEFTDGFIKNAQAKESLNAEDELIPLDIIDGINVTDANSESLVEELLSDGHSHALNRTHHDNVQSSILSKKYAPTHQTISSTITQEAAISAILSHANKKYVDLSNRPNGIALEIVDSAPKMKRHVLEPVRHFIAGMKEAAKATAVTPKPVVDVTPKPVVDVTPKPVVDTTPKTPIVEATPKIPAVEATPKIPAVEATPKIPAVEATPKIPAVEATPKIPAVEATPKIPAVEATPKTDTTPTPKKGIFGRLVDTVLGRTKADPKPVETDKKQTDTTTVDPLKKPSTETSAESKPTEPKVADPKLVTHETALAKTTATLKALQDNENGIKLQIEQNSSKLKLDAEQATVNYQQLQTDFIQLETALKHMAKTNQGWFQSFDWKSLSPTKLTQLMLGLQQAPTADGILKTGMEVALFKQKVANANLLAHQYANDVAGKLIKTPVTDYAETKLVLQQTQAVIDSLKQQSAQAEKAHAPFRQAETGLSSLFGKSKEYKSTQAALLEATKNLDNAMKLEVELRKAVEIADNFEMFLGKTELVEKSCVQIAEDFNAQEQRQAALKDVREQIKGQTEAVKHEEAQIEQIKKESAAPQIKETKETATPEIKADAPPPPPPPPVGWSLSPTKFVQKVFGTKPAPEAQTTMETLIDGLEVESPLAAAINAKKAELKEATPSEKVQEVDPLIAALSSAVSNRRLSSTTKPENDGDNSDWEDKKEDKKEQPVPQTTMDAIIDALETSEPAKSVSENKPAAVVDQKPPVSEVKLSEKDKMAFEAQRKAELDTIQKVLAKRRGDISDDDNPIAEQLAKEEKKQVQAEEKPLLGAASPTGLVKQMGALLGNFFKGKVANDADKAEEVATAPTKMEALIDGLDTAEPSPILGAASPTVITTKVIDHLTTKNDAKAPAKAENLNTLIDNLDTGVQKQAPAATAEPQTQPSPLLGAASPTGVVTKLVDFLTTKDDAKAPANAQTMDTLIDGLDTAEPSPLLGAASPTGVATKLVDLLTTKDDAKAPEKSETVNTLIDNLDTGVQKQAPAATVEPQTQPSPLLGAASPTGVATKVMDFFTGLFSSKATKDDAKAPAKAENLNTLIDNLDTGVQKQAPAATAEPQTQPSPLLGAASPTGVATKLVDFLTTKDDAKAPAKAQTMDTLIDGLDTAEPSPILGAASPTGVATKLVDLLTTKDDAKAPEKSETVNTLIDNLDTSVQKQAPAAVTVEPQTQPSPLLGAASPTGVATKLVDLLTTKDDAKAPAKAETVNTLIDNLDTGVQKQAPAATVEPQTQPSPLLGAASPTGVATKVMDFFTGLFTSKAAKDDAKAPVKAETVNTQTDPMPAAQEEPVEQESALAKALREKAAKLKKADTSTKEPVDDGLASLKKAISEKSSSARTSVKQADNNAVEPSEWDEPSAPAAKKAMDALIDGLETSEPAKPASEKKADIPAVAHKSVSTKVAPISAQEKAASEKAQSDAMQALREGLAKRRVDLADNDNPIAEKAKSDVKKPLLGEASPTGLVNKMGALLGGFFAKKVTTDADKAKESTAAPGEKIETPVPAAESKTDKPIDKVAQTTPAQTDGPLLGALSPTGLVNQVLGISKGTDGAKESASLVTQTLENFVDGLDVGGIQPSVNMASIVDELVVDAPKPASKDNLASLIDGLAIDAPKPASKDTMASLIDELSVSPATGPVLTSKDVLEQPSIFPTDHKAEQAQPKPEVLKYQQALAAVDTAYSDAKAFKANAAIDAKLWDQINPKEVAIKINQGENPAAKKAETLETKEKAQEALNAKLKEAHTAIFGDAIDAKTDVATIKQALGEKIDATGKALDQAKTDFSPLEQQYKAQSFLNYFKPKGYVEADKAVKDKTADLGKFQQLNAQVDVLDKTVKVWEKLSTAYDKLATAHESLEAHHGPVDTTAHTDTHVEAAATHVVPPAPVHTDLQPQHHTEAHL